MSSPTPSPLSIKSECSNTSDTSDASTITYEHEPFPIFSQHVLDLCRALWPSIQAVDMEHISGGSYNRVIGLTLHVRSGPGEWLHKSLIVRVPRHYGAHVERELALSSLVRLSAPIPVPEIIAYDVTSNNILGSRYTVQDRIPGSSLLSVYPTLAQERRSAFVRQYADVVLQIHNVKSDFAGVIGAVGPRNHGNYANALSAEAVMAGKSLDTNGLPQPKIIPYELKLVGRVQEDGCEVDEMGRQPIDLILFQLGRWCNVQSLNLKRYLPMMEIAYQMFHAFPDLFRGPYVLHHPDLEPRNILVENEGTTLTLTGILDWDNSIFAPRVVSCTPPMWVWAWWNESEEAEQQANDVPEDAEMRELKTLWESLMDAEFVRLSYGAEGRFARQLWRFAIYGMHSDETINEADQFIEAWGAFMQDMQIYTEAQGA